MKRLTPDEYRARFLALVAAPNESGCRLWRGWKNDNGYGMTYFIGRHRKASRVAWEIARGPIPDGMHVLHRCDVRACCSPDHLFLGTHTDNMRDMVAKGRCNKRRGESHHWQRKPELRRLVQGENNCRSKLTSEAVLALRADYAANRTPHHVAARRLGVHKSAIRKAVCGVTWRHLSSIGNKEA